ncbi:AsmA family protein [Wohlfahrtiimonas larvae]|uniref:AsmA family protein n=1 Tax=Wohlfahrtiimonas larvae TaxID=1157986 RepID=A0ABP9MW26_9GAMM|nr:AsmA family protein [Wohlfahrtiimonas larvae]
MKKLIKVFVYLILTVVVIIALAIGGIVMFINPNQFKPQITELVQKNANVILTIEGDIEWTFYPWLGLKVQNISVASPNTPTVPLADIKLAQASILLKSLFNRELNINDVVLDGLSVTLLKDANGNSNWVLPENSQEVINQVESQDDQSTSASSKKAPSLYVKSINVKDANFVYKDAVQNQALALKNLNITTGEVMLNQPISVSLNSSYLLFNPKVEGNIDFSSVVNFNVEQKHLQLRDLKLKNNIKMDDVQLLTELSTVLDLDLKTQLLQLSNLSLQNQGEIQDFAINNLQVKGIVKADLTKELVNIDQLELSMGDLALMGNVMAEKYSGDQLSFVSNIATNTFNLKALLNQLKIELPQFESKTALQKASVKLSVKGNLQNIDVNPIEIAFDDTKVNGSGAIVLGKVPTIAIALKGDRLVVNHYLPPKKQGVSSNQKTAQAHPKTKAPTNPEVIPTLPKDINIIADIQWEQLTLDQLQLANNRVKGSLKNGDAVLDQLSTNIYGGSLSFSGALKGQKTPKLNFNGKIQKINLTQVLPQISLKDYINNEFILSRLNQNHKNINIEGMLNAQFSLTTSGRLQNQVIANLNGDANFDLAQGRVNNLNYEKLMCQGIALLNQKNLTGTFNRTYTDFQKLSGKIIIRNGVVTNDPFQMLVPGLAVNGKGDINLNRMTINYGLNAVLTGDHSINSDPACQINERFQGIPIPLICEGSLEKTDGLCRLDSDQLGKVIANLATNAVKEKAQKELDKQKEKIQDKLDGEIEKQLKKNPAVKGLLKNLL